MHCQHFDELILLLTQHCIKDYIFYPYSGKEYQIFQFTLESNGKQTIIYSSYPQTDENYDHMLKAILKKYWLRSSKSVCNPTRWISIYEYQSQLQQQLKTTITINENLPQHYTQPPCHLPCILAKSSYLGHKFQSTHFLWSLLIGPLDYNHLVMIRNKVPPATTVLLNSASLLGQQLGRPLSGYTLC